ncbi:MAG: dihydrofolate reductase [Alcaligenaceae bacterium]|nr:dihydrofolate reductase [Alcaligenaceae bacterium]
MSSINIIVAYSRNNIIGNHGQMPWSIPSDLAYFKETTMGSPIIMGRVTWESLGRPLPGRLNIVISRNSSYEAEGAELVDDLESAIALAKEKAPEQDIFIIGGGQIYAQALDSGLADKVYATEIHNKIEGDTSFPELDMELWKEISRDPQPIDNDYDFDFVIYQRR